MPGLTSVSPINPFENLPGRFCKGGAAAQLSSEGGTLKHLAITTERTKRLSKLTVLTGIFVRAPAATG